MAGRIASGSGARARRRCERGFTYVGLLIAVAVFASVLGAVATVWQTFSQREQEKHLLFVGNEFRAALERYFNANQRYPDRLEQLILDDGKAVPTRYLRKVYFDPLTGESEWGTVRLVSGQIVGVYSLSARTPVKIAGFAARDSGFENSRGFADWLFLAAGQTAIAGVGVEAPPASAAPTAPAPVRAPSRFR